MKRTLIFAALIAALIAPVWAQRVGDTVTVNGQRYTIQSINGDDILLRKAGRYEVIEESLSWTDAKAAAERRGGYLAVITSAEEQKTIEDLVTRSGGARRGYWLGGYSEGNKVFKWVTGEPMGYTNWAPTQPDGSANTQRILFLRTTTMGARNENNFGKWDDDRISGSDRYGYIIEWD